MKLVTATLLASLFFGSVAVPGKAAAPVLQPPPPLVAPPKPTRSKHEQERVAKTMKEVSLFIRRVNRDVVPARVEKLASAIVENCMEKHLDPLVVSAILAQESRFQPGLHVCHIRQDLARGFTCDVGLGQVNWDTWGEKLDLDFRRLVTDDDYNIAVATTLLRELRRSHGNDPLWWAYYHDHREAKREVYVKLVTSRLPTVRPSVVARL